MPKRRIIIIATDNNQTRDELHTLFLDDSEWKRVYAHSGQEALEAAQKYEGDITIFFLDAALADDYGIAAVRFLQAPATVDCPPVVILIPRGEQLSGQVPDDLFVSEIIETPVESRIAMRRLRVLLDLHAYQMKDVSFLHTVSRDPLLGLLSGNALTEATDEAIERSGGVRGLAIHINVDNLRAINERSGYHFGDLLLVDLAKTLRDLLPEDAVIGRSYGDNFCVFLPGRPDANDDIQFLENIKRQLKRRYQNAPGGPQEVTVCIGAAQYPEDGQNSLALYEAAETANSKAKKLGRDVLLFYSSAMQRRKHKAQPDAEAQALLPRRTVYVPLLTPEDDAVAGYGFMTISSEEEDMELTDLILQAGTPADKSAIHRARIDLRNSFSTLHDLSQEGLALPNASFLVKMRGEDAPMMAQMLQQCLNEHPIDAEKVCIHISQQMVLELSSAQLETLARDVRALGFTFGVYGVGHESIVNACFREQQLDSIQFSPEFTQDILNGEYSRGFMETILAYFAQSDLQLCFPLELSQISLVMLANGIGTGFTSLGPVLGDKAALTEHLKSHPQNQNLVKRHKKQRTLHIGDEQYNEIFSQSGILLFDWRPHENVTAYSASFDTLYGETDADDSLEVRMETILHPQDTPRLMQLLEQVKHGRPAMDGIFRVRRHGESTPSYHWRRFFIIPSGAEGGIVRHVFCISIDVDREQREMEDIRKKAEIDPLTGVFNRGATERHIRSFLEGQGSFGHHALMIVDIDDFKSINDNFGHMEGDQALQHIAREMQRLFRKDDIIGRIGGDEFMVFLKNIESEDMVVSRASDICEAGRSGKPEWNMSCTVGVARYPQEGQTFETLYAKADLALYKAKEAGKNQLKLYIAEDEDENKTT